MKSKISNLVVCLLMIATVFVAMPTLANSSEQPTIKIGWIQYGGDWLADPSAPSNLLNQLASRTGYQVIVDFVPLESLETLKQYDLLILTGHLSFLFSETERAVLKAYLLEDCGLLFIDDCNNIYDVGFEQSVREEMLNMFGKPFTDLPTDFADPAEYLPVKSDASPP